MSTASLASFFIEPQTLYTRSIPFSPGVHPEARIQYRPSLPLVREQHAAKFKSADPAALDAFEVELLDSHVATINGQRVPRGRFSKLTPGLFRVIVDLVLGFEPPDDPAAATGAHGEPDDALRGAEAVASI